MFIICYISIPGDEEQRRPSCVDPLFPHCLHIITPIPGLVQSVISLDTSAKFIYDIIRCKFIMLNLFFVNNELGSLTDNNI